MRLIKEHSFAIQGAARNNFQITRSLNRIILYRGQSTKGHTIQIIVDNGYCIEKTATNSYFWGVRGTAFKYKFCST